MCVQSSDTNLGHCVLHTLPCWGAILNLWGLDLCFDPTDVLTVPPVLGPVVLSEAMLPALLLPLCPDSPPSPVAAPSGRC